MIRVKPLLSIVIANYNYGRFLDEAIQSILTQGFDDKVELIICDAASTDNSVEIIHKYVDQIAWWCSEKDGGQSAAFNKGFLHAHGEWLTWLNADDVLLPGTLREFERTIKRRPYAKWITGNEVYFDSDTRKIRQVCWGPHCQMPFLRGRLAFSAVFGPTTFWKKELYERLGPIDEMLHYAMDTEYWARMTMHGIRQVRMNWFCWGFRIHGDSKTEGVQSVKVAEMRAKETAYWRTKLKYNFTASIKNPWYVMWCLWRIVDGSWIRRFLLKHKFEGHAFSEILGGLE